MKKLKQLFLRFVVVLLVCNSALAAQALTFTKAHAATPSSPSVIINEVMWPGSYQGTVSHADDEWLELVNTSPSPVNITGWTLSGVGGSFTVGTDGQTKNAVIPAAGYYIISHYNLGSPSTVLAVQPDWIVPGMSILNSCQPITLSSADSTVSDTMGCDASNTYFGGVNDTTNHVRKSLERLDTLNADGTVSVGSGLVKASWTTAADHGNLTDSLHNFATPALFNNDTTAPVLGTVTDVTSTHLSVITDTTQLSASWTGFADAETGLNSYQVSASSTPDTANLLLPFQNVGLATTSTITGLNLAVGQTYYFLVSATNNVGLTSSVAVSSGVTVVNPTAPVTNLTASDVPNDNGGSIRLNWSASADADHYLVNYSELGSNVTTGPINVGNQTEYILTGLNNAPAVYQFNVTAVAVNALPSAAVSVTGSAVDNSAPLPATLTSLASTCQATACNVTVEWTSGDSSTAYYQVQYQQGSSAVRTMDLLGTSVTLSLPPTGQYSFAVFAYDAAGNQSPASNVFAPQLQPYQQLTMTYVSGQVNTTVTQLPRPTPVVRPAVARAVAAPVSLFVPATAQAAPVAQNTSPAATTNQPAATSSDVTHVLVIVLILLLVALGFYVLSRRLREDNPTSKPKRKPAKKLAAKTKEIKSKAAAVSGAGAVVKRGRGRPKGSTKKPPAPAKPKRGRGRPKGSLNKKKRPS